MAAAEDALGDAFRAALETWPGVGVPEKPEAWLLAVARRRLVDAARHTSAGVATAADLRIVVERAEEAAASDGVFPDERLKLLFVCAHPAITLVGRPPRSSRELAGLELVPDRAAPIAASVLGTVRRMREGPVLP